jgi:hypothetical protein
LKKKNATRQRDATVSAREIHPTHSYASPPLSLCSSVRCPLPSSPVASVCLSWFACFPAPSATPRANEKSALAQGMTREEESGRSSKHSHRLLTHRPSVCPCPLPLFVPTALPCLSCPAAVAVAAVVPCRLPTHKAKPATPTHTPTRKHDDCGAAWTPFVPLRPFVAVACVVPLRLSSPLGWSTALPSSSPVRSPSFPLSPPPPLSPAAMSLSFKVVLLGEGRVGKTCLCLRYVQNSFSADQESTIQATYLDKRLNLGKRSVKLMIWDTAGQERFHALGPIYYRSAIVFTRGAPRSAGLCSGPARAALLAIEARAYGR